MPMTPDEQNVWEYVEQESNELIVKLGENAERDGFGNMDAELTALKVASASMIKLLAIVSEKSGNVDLTQKYMELVPLHVELIKVYSFRALERN